jgi:hypothetical protein
MPHAPAARVLGTVSLIPGQSREAACRLDEPTSAGVSDQPHTAVWIAAEARIGLRPALPGVASAAAACA